MGCCHGRILRALGRLRAFLRPPEVGGIYGYAVSDHAHHQRGDDRLSVLRVAASGEVLK